MAHNYPIDATKLKIKKKQINYDKRRDFMTNKESVRLMNEIDIYKEILTDLSKTENDTL